MLDVVKEVFVQETLEALDMDPWLTEIVRGERHPSLI